MMFTHLRSLKATSWTIMMTTSTCILIRQPILQVSIMRRAHLLARSWRLLTVSSQLLTPRTRQLMGPQVVCIQPEYVTSRQVSTRYATHEKQLGTWSTPLDLKYCEY